MNHKLKKLYDDAVREVNSIILKQRKQDVIKCIQILFELDIDVSMMMKYLDKYYDIKGMNALRCIEKARLYSYYESYNHCDYYLVDKDMPFYIYVNDLIHMHRDDYLEDDLGIDYIVDIILEHS